MIKQNKFGDFGKQYIIGIYMTVTTGKTLTSRHQWKIHMFYNIGYLHIFICNAAGPTKQENIHQMKDRIFLCKNCKS